MSSTHKSLKLCHSLLRILGKVWIHVVVVADCIWGTGLALDKLWVRSEASPIGLLSGVSQHSGVPDVGTSEPVEVFKRLVVYVRELSGAVFGQRTILDGIFSIVAPETREHLIDYRFVHDISFLRREDTTK